MSDKDVAIVVLGGLAAVALGIGIIAATSGPEHDYTTLCQDADYVRLEDSRCDRGDSGSFVMFISTSSNYNVPPVGGKISQNQVVKSVPAGKTVQRGAISASGGVVKSSPGITRGGFGGKSSSSGG